MLGGKISILLLLLEFCQPTCIIYGYIDVMPSSWQISELHDLIDGVTCSYDKFFFGDAGREIYDFFWGDFADWYDFSVASLSSTSKIARHILPPGLNIDSFHLIIQSFPTIVNMF